LKTNHFQKSANAIYQKLSKLVHACQNYSLPKSAHFLDTVAQIKTNSAKTVLCSQHGPAFFLHKYVT